MSTEFRQHWLSAYLDDELSIDERALVEQQLEKDPATRHLLEDLQRVRGMVASLPRGPESEFKFDFGRLNSQPVEHDDKELVMVMDCAVESNAAARWGEGNWRVSEPPVSGSPVGESKAAPVSDARVGGSGRIGRRAITALAACTLLAVVAYPFWVQQFAAMEVATSGPAPGASRGGGPASAMDMPHPEMDGGLGMPGEPALGAPATLSAQAGEANVMSKSADAPMLAESVTAESFSSSQAAGPRAMAPGSMAPGSPEPMEFGQAAAGGLGGGASSRGLPTPGALPKPAAPAPAAPMPAAPMTDPSPVANAKQAVEAENANSLIERAAERPGVSQFFSEPLLVYAHSSAWSEAEVQGALGQVAGFVAPEAQQQLKPAQSVVQSAVQSAPSLVAGLPETAPATTWFEQLQQVQPLTQLHGLSLMRADTGQRPATATGATSAGSTAPDAASAKAASAAEEKLPVPVPPVEGFDKNKVQASYRNGSLVLFVSEAEAMKILAAVQSPKADQANATNDGPPNVDGLRYWRVTPASPEQAAAAAMAETQPADIQPANARPSATQPSSAEASPKAGGPLVEQPEKVILILNQPPQRN
ncbi:MAG: zf-HC2 domain-containing protein [Pirellulaceae bacterium]|nr:zf-HC2 domain-containing protein [Pirellulaceae bacterium]